MERFLKYYLSVLVLFCLFSCDDDDYKNLSHEERKILSARILNEGEHMGQGSPRSMSRIERAIKINPNNCDALRELSVAMLKRGLIDEWKPAFDKAVACNPKMWVPWRGYLYLQFYRDYDKAIADFNASDTLTPNFIDAPQGHSVDYWRGIAYLGLKDYKNSLAYFDKYISKETKDTGEDWVEPTAFLYKAIAHYENNETALGLETIEKNIKYNSNKTADGHYYKALLLERNGDFEQAKSSLNLAIEYFKKGYYNTHDYTEMLRQIYMEDLATLYERLNN